MDGCVNGVPVGKLRSSQGWYGGFGMQRVRRLLAIVRYTHEHTLVGLLFLEMCLCCGWRAIFSSFFFVSRNGAISLRFRNFRGWRQGFSTPPSFAFFVYLGRALVECVTDT